MALLLPIVSSSFFFVAAPATPAPTTPVDAAGVRDGESARATEGTRGAQATSESPSPPPRDVVALPELPNVSLAAQPPFEIEAMTLSDVLREAIEHNFTLRSNAVDVDISETTILSALGAYDVFLTSGVTGSLSKTPQRGSQINFNRGSRTLSAFIGFRRMLETGGTIELQIDASRTLSEQPINFFDIADPRSISVATYRIAPTLTISHPLLRGAGLAVNRAAINRARIATNQAEAQRLLTARNITRDLIGAYWQVVFAMHDLQNKRRSVELARRQLERTQALVEAGRLAPVDAKAIEQAVAARESDVLLAENALMDASLTMRTLAGQDLHDRTALGVLPTTDPLVEARPVDTRDLVQRALAADPQIRQLELTLASRRIDELEAANQRLPQLDLTGSFTPQGRSADVTPRGTEPGQKGSWAEAFQNFFNEDVRDGLLADWTIQGTLSLTWDVQNRAPKGNHERVLAEMRRATLDLDVMRQTTAATAIRAAQNLRTAKKRIEVANVSLELANENLMAESARFQVGRSTNYDLRLRLDELDQAQAAALSARLDYLRGLVQVQALTGEILPAYGLDIP